MRFAATAKARGSGGGGRWFPACSWLLAATLVSVVVVGNFMLWQSRSCAGKVQVGTGTQRIAACSSSHLAREQATLAANAA